MVGGCLQRSLVFCWEYPVDIPSWADPPASEHPLPTPDISRHSTYRTPLGVRSHPPTRSSRGRPTRSWPVPRRPKKYMHTLDLCRPRRVEWTKFPCIWGNQLVCCHPPPSRPRRTLSPERASHRGAAPRLGPPLRLGRLLLRAPQLGAHGLARRRRGERPCSVRKARSPPSSVHALALQ